MLKNLTSITATKRVALLCCVLVLIAASVAMGQQGVGSGSGRGSGVIKADERVRTSAQPVRAR